MIFVFLSLTDFSYYAKEMSADFCLHEGLQQSQTVRHPRCNSDVSPNAENSMGPLLTAGPQGNQALYCGIDSTGKLL